MRYVQLVRMGTPACGGAEMLVPYNGDEFEFLAEEWRGLARRAAATEGGKLREGLLFAWVFPCDTRGHYNPEFLGAQPARAGEDY